MDGVAWSSLLLLLTRVPCAAALVGRQTRCSRACAPAEMSWSISSKRGRLLPKSSRLTSSKVRGVVARDVSCADWCSRLLRWQM
jgi:hypothetical protein